MPVHLTSWPCRHRVWRLRAMQTRVATASGGTFPGITAESGASRPRGARRVVVRVSRWLTRRCGMNTLTCRTLSALSGMTFIAPIGAQAPPGQGYVPLDQLPPADQLPAAPLLIAAYAFVWLAVLFYVWTIWHRLHKVDDEMRVLE